MFTGIIEEIGIVKSINSQSDSFSICIKASKVLSDVNLGDSISVNGTCLTVSKFNSQEFFADVMPETLKATNLGSLKASDSVNLERAMSPSGRFGGHLVSGHVDSIGVIDSIKEDKNARYIKIKTNHDVLKFLVLKGSICVDGTSLTVFGIDDISFTLSLIPHTLQMSIIGSKKQGDVVNLEVDTIAKYVYSFLNKKNESNKSNISMDFLKENGF